MKETMIKQSYNPALLWGLKMMHIKCPELSGYSKHGILPLKCISYDFSAEIIYTQELLQTDSI